MPGHDKVYMLYSKRYKCLRINKLKKPLNFSLKPIVILDLILDVHRKFLHAWLESRIFLCELQVHISAVHFTHFLILFPAHNKIELMSVLGKSSWVGGLLFFSKILNPQSIVVGDRQTKLSVGQKLLPGVSAQRWSVYCVGVLSCFWNATNTHSLETLAEDFHLDYVTLQSLLRLLERRMEPAGCITFAS